MMAGLELDISQRIVAGNRPDTEHEKKVDPNALTSLQRPQPTSTPAGTGEGEGDESSEDKYPEGGSRAWLVVLGSWCAIFPSMGLLNTIGILHAWTTQHQLASYSSSSVGWIYGVFAFCLYFGSAQVGTYYEILFASLRMTLSETD